MPRPRRLQPCARSTTMALHVRHVSRASSSQAQAAATAAGTPATMLGALGLPRLSTGSANECRALASEKQPQRARQPGRRPGRVAGNGSSPAGDGSPLARKRVIDNSNTSGHVPQHARQLFRCSGDGGRSRVFAGRSGVFAGRKSGLRYRGYISGHPLPPLFFRCTAAPHPWQARGHLPPGPPQDQVGGTPLKSNKCHWSSGRGRHY